MTADNRGMVNTDSIYLIGPSLLEDPQKDIWVFRLITTGEELFSGLPYKVCQPEQAHIGDSLRVHGFSFRIAEENLMVTDSLISGINGNNGSCVISAKIDHGNSGGGDNGHFE